MPDRLNILFLMTDQMQGRVLEPGHVCQTPNLDRLAAGGVRIRNAYTPNAVCSPARASLMTGLLPHNHGVLEVTHTVDDDQCCLRLDKPHWAQRLSEAGYLTGYFGKWHVERSNDLKRFGWQVDGGAGGKLFGERKNKVAGHDKPKLSLAYRHDRPEGYDPALLYAVTDQPPEHRNLGLATGLALEFLNEAKDHAPWCCFVSVPEPHDAYVVGEAAFAPYDPDKIELPPNANDDLAHAPGAYRKIARTWAGLTARQKKEAAACYYALISEIDSQFGRVLAWLEQSGQAENTVVVFTSDHGDLLGAHGMWFKNIGAFEEVYNIPLLVRGPGLGKGVVSDARAGLHDLGPTLLDLAGLPGFGAPDSRSLAPLLRDPEQQGDNFRSGFAEYYGSRMRFTQRVVWDGPWKLVFNGFDTDELYRLDQDPHERHNRIDDPDCREILRGLCKQMWQRIRDTGDHALLRSHYGALRMAPFGPNILD